MLNLLRRIVQDVRAASTFQGALSIMVNAIYDAISADVASVYLLDREQSRYVLVATRGLNASAVGKAYLPLASGVVGLVGQREELINLDDVSEHPRFHFLEGIGEEHLKAFLAVPILRAGRVLGVMVVQRRIRCKFAQDDEAFLATLSVQLADTIAQAQAMGNVEFATRNPESVKRLTGVVSSSGIGVGVAVLCQPLTAFDAVPQRKIANQEIAGEVARFGNAVERVKRDIDQLRRKVGQQLSPEEMMLFDVYARLLEDKLLYGAIEERIREGYRADSALSAIISRQILRFEQMDDLYLRERVVDLKDLGERMLNALAQKTRCWASLPERVVLIGEVITTTCLMEFPRDRIAAVVTRQGTVNSHMAIVARSLGIPTVVGILDLKVSQLLDDELIVDGYCGEVLWQYSEQVRNTYYALMKDDSHLHAEFERLRDVAAQTADGQRVALWLNTGLIADTSTCVDCGVVGVGLYRSEIPFLVQDRFPSEDEQVVLYRKQLKAFAPLPVTMRTLDVGGDKALPYFPIQEDNPFLGWRGLRISLDHPDIFITQVRAMLIASAGLANLRVLLPMVSTLGEVDEAKKILLRAYHSVIEEGCDVQMPEIGVMIEVPAAVFQLKDLAKRVDFLSVGTNDLIQYFLAVDRNNSRVAALCEPYHPAVLRILYRIVLEADQHRVPVSVCGEMAGEPVLAILLVAMGYRHLSMNANNIMRVKWALSQVSLTDIQALFAHVIEMECSASIKLYLQSHLASSGLGELMRLIFPSCRITG
ncbi:MAG: phosphoenolpyruvate--protein phosphotransferase [Gammaproteobacteria bacterium]